MTTPAPTPTGLPGLVREDLFNFRWLDEIALAPDGRQVAYTIRRPHAGSNGYEAHLFVRTLPEGEEPGAVRQLTAGFGQASSLAWDQTGRRLAFVWSDGKNSSVEIRGEEDNEGTGSFSIEGAPFSGLCWSADGAFLAGVRWTPIPEEQAGDERPAGVPAPTIKIIKRLRYKQDGTGWVHDRFQQIWALELATGRPQQITHDECDYSEPAWSGSGRKLAFIGLAREQNIPLGQGQIFVCDVPGGTPYRLMPDWTGACRSPQWGDGDRQIAFAGHENPPPVNRRIFMKPYMADVASGAARNLAPEIDEEVGNYAVADQRKGLSNITVKWPRDGQWIYFLLTERGGSHLYRIDTQGRYERLVHGDSVTFEYSPAAGEVVAYGQADPQNPGELYLWQAGESRQLTDLNPWLKERHLYPPESYTYAGVDGTPVQAWLIKSAAAEAGNSCPTIVYVHCSMFSWDFNHEFQTYANAGYVVAYFNQRGTTAGYGQAWTRASEGDQGGLDYEEVMLGVDDLVQRPFVDGSRLGVTGGSCGGFMTNWVIGHTDRFKAAVTQRSITNQISFFGNADIGPECTEAETGASPWGDLEAVWRQSPIAYADRVTTPLLIIHSDEDYRCALEQAEQLFAALRWMGKEVEMVIFEGENHGLSRGGRPGNRIERLRQIQGWFDRHL